MTVVLKRERERKRGWGIAGRVNATEDCNANFLFSTSIRNQLTITKITPGFYAVAHTITAESTRSS